MEDSVPYSSMKEISPVVGCWEVVGAGSLSPGVAQHFRGLQQHCLIRIVLLEGSQLLLQVRRGFSFASPLLLFHLPLIDLIEQSTVLEEKGAFG